MNKWEKEVQASLLSTEAEALKAIEKNYNSALNNIMLKVKQFDAEIADLDKAMNSGGIDLGEQIKLLTVKQSKIYQKQYQEALQGQITDVLDKMYSDNYTTIKDYLINAYSDAFVGNMYELQKQGIPLIMPIDQVAVTKAVLLDSKISKGLYNHLGVDVQDLKKNIATEISRGIAGGYSYAQISRNLANAAGISRGRANNIIRTEGHRIQQASTMDAQQIAKSRGANVKKQWDATLDGRTRIDHQLLDGQIKEIDQPFEINSKKADAPGYFGDPAEDCNCRCVSLTRAKWALDDEELKTLQDRAAFFGLDKTQSFEDFKQKYLNVASQAAPTPIPIKKEYLTEKKLNEKINDLNDQQNQLLSGFKDKSDFDLNASQMQKMLMQDLENQKADYQSKLDKKILQKEKKVLTKQKLDLEKQINSTQVKTYSFPGNSGKWSNVTTADFDSLKDEIDKKIKYFEGQAYFYSADPADMAKNIQYVKDLKELKAEGQALSDLKSELSKLNVKIKNLGKPQPVTSAIDNIIANAKTFSSGSDAINYHTANNFSRNIWDNVLTDDERYAVRAYTGSSYSQMNKDLRMGNYLNSSKKVLIDDCTSALSKTKIADDVLVYRGMGSQKSVARLFGITEAELADPNVIPSLIGKTVTEKGFMSTAITPGRAWSGAKLEVYLPKGANAMFVDPISQYSGELELLVQRNSTFVVKDIISDASGNVSKIVMVLVDQTI